MSKKTYRTLVSTDILANHLNDPAWITIDCRFDLQKPEWGLQDYQRGHIPGAIYANLNTELSGPIRPNTGRHPLPNPDHWIETLSSWGVNSSKQIIAYDTTGGSFASRLWWMLRWVGHTKVAVLDGGYAKWQHENRLIRAGVEVAIPSVFTGRPRWEMVLDAQSVEHIRLDPHYRLIDARSAQRFEGKEELIDPVAGHIPGAINRFHGDNLTQDGVFYPSHSLNARFREILGNVPPSRAIVYCGSGVTSCHHLLAMEYAGLSGARLYAGSWSEWIRDPDRPRAIGRETPVK